MIGESSEIQLQYAAVGETAGWLKLSGFEALELSGPDRISFLNSYNSQDIKNLGESRATYGTVLTQKGKLISDTRILHLPEKILLIVAAGFSQKILEHWKTYLMFSNVELTERTKEWTCFGVFGPKANALLAASLSPELPASAGEIASWSFENSTVYAIASEGFGLVGWELFAPALLEGGILSRLEERGRSMEISPISEAVLEIFRVEAGLPKMGVDMSEDNLVAEVGLDKRATSFNKGCYLGQETTARVNSQGHVNRSLVRFKLERSYAGLLPVEILSKGKTFGRLTSLVDSPRFGGPVGLGLVHRMAWEGDEGLWIQDSKGKIKLEKL